jgi:SAM-dependent methyltransferase
LSQYPFRARLIRRCASGFNVDQSAIDQVGGAEFNEQLFGLGHNMSIWADFLTNQERPVCKWTHYFPVYERHLDRFRNLSVTMIEIGCGDGGSLQMWKRYLGPFARIVGVDIRPECVAFTEDQIDIRIGDQGNPHFLRGLIDEFGPVDVVVDDGSHVMSHLSTSFKTVYPLISRNGAYIVEDLHTCYWSEYGGGYRHPDSFIERCKGLLDELNADHSRGSVPVTDFSRLTFSMHFYDSLAVFERGIHIKKQSLQIGGQ